jgi:hypothetical protein
VIGRVTVLVAASIAAVIAGLVDAAPIWTLTVLACMAWGVYLVFLAVVNRQPAPQPCSCPTCRAPRAVPSARLERLGRS